MHSSEIIWIIITNFDYQLGIHVEAQLLPSVFIYLLVLEIRACPLGITLYVKFLFAHSINKRLPFRYNIIKRITILCHINYHQHKTRAKQGEDRLNVYHIHQMGTLKHHNIDNVGNFYCPKEIPSPWVCPCSIGNLSWQTCNTNQLLKHAKIKEA